jgi:uncharacterized membrane protein
MSAGALGLVLASAVAHATWNLLAKRASGGAAFVWLFTTCSAVFYAPLAVGAVLVLRPTIGAVELLFIVGTAVLHLAYYLLLQRGYRVGDLSFVYPLARGTGPILATVGAIAILGERPSALALVGAALVATGIIILIGRLSHDRHLREAMLFALATGALIAAYTLWDKYAVSSLSIPPLLLNWANDFGRALLLTPVIRGRRDQIKEVWRTHRPEVLGVAILSPVAYVLILVALTFSPASYVAPAREVGILFGAMLGIRYLYEAHWQRRLIGASAIVAGVVALAIG